MLNLNWLKNKMKPILRIRFLDSGKIRMLEFERDDKNFQYQLNYYKYTREEEYPGCRVGKPWNWRPAKMFEIMGMWI